MLKRGCERFAAWGWTTGDPALEYQLVQCPAAFEALVGGAFDETGVVPLPTPSPPVSPLPSMPLPGLPPLPLPWQPEASQAAWLLRRGKRR